MRISVMWMTRKRSHELVYSICSFMMKANNNKDIEYIVISDPDDEDTYSAVDKINKMSFETNIINLKSPKRYGYEELEGYQNLVGEIFTGECIFIMNDDLICLNNGWDDEIRKELKPFNDVPRWLGLAGVNENWKGATTFVGINRKWYETTGRVSGNRATDGYIMSMGKALGLEPLRPKVHMLHLQRGSGNIKFIWKDEKYVCEGLPDDGLGGYPTKSPKPPKYYHDPNEFTNNYTDFEEGKKRFDEDLNNLRRYHG